MSEMRVLIVGTGTMANAHAEAYAGMPGVRLAGGVDLNPGRRLEFLARHRLQMGFSSVAEALEWGEFDAVSNVTPDAVHHPTTLPLLGAGKHVLCEKPLAETYEKARQMADAADRVGVVNMVNLTYRNVAALIQAHAMVAAGEIGEVRHFEASYLQSWLTQPAWGEWSEEQQWLWRLSSAHGSLGVLGDVGVHILDFATYAAGHEVAERLVPAQDLRQGSWRVASASTCSTPTTASRCIWSWRTARRASSMPAALPPGTSTT